MKLMTCNLQAKDLEILCIFVLHGFQGYFEEGKVYLDDKLSNFLKYGNFQAQVFL